MGCLCSKGPDIIDYVAEYEKERDNEKSRCSSVQLIAPSNEEEFMSKRVDGPCHAESKISSVVVHESMEDNPKMRIIERPQKGHRRHSTLDSGVMQKSMSTIVSMPHGVRGEQAAAGWPSWLTAVAAEAVKGWTPRSADSYEKLNKIGQGTYSSVYKARDLKTEKTVAMKKVRFMNMDPESVRFMAREICILRRLDHPNVMKLEALVTSRVSGSLYLVFEYMEHDLAGLVASHRAQFTEPQIKCYMHQILQGLKHCHSVGILHRDIKGANILVGSNGILKIADFGLAAIVEQGRKHPLTSRVVTLWYRAPELLLGETDYGAAIDLWSVGCILGELFTGKPIMPGRTEVEQMHKIFKLCGSPTEEYWKRAKVPHATSFKSQPSYKRRVSEMFKDLAPSALALLEVLLSIDPDDRGSASSALSSGFFTSKPLPCDPSNLPNYPPSKEFDIKMREEARRQRGESVKGENASKDQSKQNNTRQQGYNPNARIEPARGNYNAACSKSVIHPNAAAGYPRNRNKDDNSHSVHASHAELNRQESQVQKSTAGTSFYLPNDVRGRRNNNSTDYEPKRTRIIFSGPLMPPGGNTDDMLKEHERQIQEAVRKARHEKR